MQGKSDPIVLSRRSFALETFTICARRGPSLRSTLSSPAAQKTNFGRRANVRLIQNLLPVQARLSSPQRENP